MDFLRVYDGPSADAPKLAELSGKAIPGPIVSTGRSVYLHFTSSDASPAVGFKVSFRCAGTRVEYWKPADTAVPLLLVTPPLHEGAAC